jgi:hypothetical protein
MKKLADLLGGRLEAPQAGWKYYWIQKAFGWSTAKRAQFLLPALKSAVIRHLDKMMYVARRAD